MKIIYNNPYRQLGVYSTSPQKEVVATSYEITCAIKSFVGEISQIPPMYSAVKVQGKKQIVARKTDMSYMRAFLTKGVVFSLK